MHTCALEDEVVKICRVVEAFPLKFWCACGVQVAGLTSWCGSPMVVGCFRRCSLEDSLRVTYCWCVSSMGFVLRAGPLDGEEYGCVLAVPLPMEAPHFQRICGRSSFPCVVDASFLKFWCVSSIQKKSLRSFFPFSKKSPLLLYCPLPFSYGSLTSFRNIFFPFFFNAHGYPESVYMVTHSW